MSDRKAFSQRYLTCAEDGQNQVSGGPWAVGLILLYPICKTFEAFKHRMPVTSVWLSGFIYLAWAVYGYRVEYVKKIEWRSPPRWAILIPYVFLYLGSVMFYWWPLALIRKPLWYVYAALFVVSTMLNVTSHKRSSIR